MYLVDHVLPKSATVCYFFFKVPYQNTARQALCALLHQLFCAKPALIEHAMTYFEREGPKLSDSTDILWEILRSAVMDQTAGPVVLVLDAMDECAEPDLEDMVHHIKELADSSVSDHTKLRLLLTSRPYESIVSEFRGSLDPSPRIYVQGEEHSATISDEVNLVIRHRIDRLAIAQRLSPEIKDHLMNQLLKIQHRTFLWVHLMCDHLKSEGFKKTKQGVDLAIQRLPKSVSRGIDRC